MTSLTSLTNLVISIKKYSKPFAAITFVAIVVGLLVLRYAPFGSSKNLPPLDKPYFDPLATKLSAVYSQKLNYEQKQPKTLATYKGQSTGSFLENTQQFATKLGFNDKPKEFKDVVLGQTMAYSNAGATLSIHKDSISYQKNLKPVPAGKIDIDLLKNKALAYFNNLNLNTTNLGDPEINYTYIQGEDLVESKDQNNASFVKLSYFPKLDGIKLITHSHTEIIMDTNSSVMGFAYKNSSVSQKQAEYPLISPQQALSMATSGRGQLVDADGSILGTTLKQLPPVQLNNMYLAYFYNPAKSDIDIQPVWFFEGESDVKTIKLNIVITVPAIAEKYFKTNQL